MRRPLHLGRWLAAGIAGLALALAALVWWAGVRVVDDAEAVPEPALADAALVERGRYLARAGNCMSCHTAVGGAAYAGGRAVHTPFGAVYSSNITPHDDTGLGRWSAADFRRALRHGKRPDGRLLNPAFPYPNYAQVTPADADALLAYLRTVAPVEQANRPHDLGFPYNAQAALAVWRALFFRPEPLQAEPERSLQWQRGRYLVEGLGHCAACHSERNRLGGIASAARLVGGPMPDGAWYAPSLADPKEAGVAGWSQADVVQLLKTGRSAQATASGPMAEVVFHSTQHLRDDDLAAIAEYLASLPSPPPRQRTARPAQAGVLQHGGQVYTQHCAACHGEQGQGVPGLYPALAGNRAVNMDSPANVVQMVLHGGFAPATAGNPRPFGMPPFLQVLSDADVAAVTSYVRQSWGHDAPAVSELQVRRSR